MPSELYTALVRCPACGEEITDMIDGELRKRLDAVRKAARVEEFLLSCVSEGNRQIDVLEIERDALARELAEAQEDRELAVAQEREACAQAAVAESLNLCTVDVRDVDRKTIEPIMVNYTLMVRHEVAAAIRARSEPARGGEK